MSNEHKASKESNQEKKQRTDTINEAKKMKSDIFTRGDREKSNIGKLNNWTAP